LSVERRADSASWTTCHFDFRFDTALTLKSAALPYLLLSGILDSGEEGEFMKQFLILTAAIITVFPASQAFAQNNPLPSDVSPDSRNRLPLLKPENAPERAKRTYDNAMANFAGAQPRGPLMRLHASPVTNLQMQSPVGMDLAQVAILTTGREHDQPYEWSLHELQALSVSLDPAIIDVIRRKESPSGAGEKEAVIIQVGREIFRTHKLGSDTYARALGILGRTNLVDVVSLMADYAGVCATLTAFNQQMPSGFKQFLPLPFTPPNDIHPDSANRLPLLPAQPYNATVLYTRPMTPEGTGPGQIRRHGGGLKSLEASVARRDIDLAILVTAREHDSQYDWTMNELEAEKDGLEPSVIDVVREHKPTTGLMEKDASLIDLGRELFSKHVVATTTYTRVVKVFGERDLVDLVAVMGQHASEATMLAAFDQHLPAGQAPR
jgi:4-carboxymuconolactone decarboxylase